MSSPASVNRREFLRAGVGGAAAPAFLRAAGRRPNVLVIMSDEHNQRVAGCYGNRTVRTPNIDRLAGGGVTFDAAYTNSPLCVPARLAFTAGKYVHRISAWNNDCMLPRNDYPTLPNIMNAAGYESFLCGKQHYDNDHRYGFREIGGNMNDNHHKGRGGRRKADDQTVNLKVGQARFAEFKTAEESSIMNHDRRVTAGAVEFLSQRQRGDKPFFLFTGYLAPHFPLTVPERYWRNYKDRIPMPEIPPGFLGSLPLNYQHLRRGFGIVEQPADIVRRGRELYYGLTEWVDNEIGKVLEALRRSPFARDTVVVYTTDHGENMGEHGLWWKNCVYDQAARIPLIVNWPERWKGGQRRGGACGTVDVVRTIAEIGGARTPEDWNGESLVRQMDDAGARGRDIAVSQYYAHNIASGYAMLRTDEWKYCYHSAPDGEHPAERELYNLKDDPQEFRNLAKDPAHAGHVERLQAALVKELGEHPDESELRCRAELAKGYGRPPGTGRAADVA